MQELDTDEKILLSVSNSCIRGESLTRQMGTVNI